MRRFNLLGVRNPRRGLLGVGKAYGALMAKKTGHVYMYLKTHPKYGLTHPKALVPGGTINYLMPASKVYKYTPYAGHVAASAHYRPKVVQDLKQMLGYRGAARRIGKGAFGGAGAFTGLGRGWRRFLKRRGR